MLAVTCSHMFINLIQAFDPYGGLHTLCEGDVFDAKVCRPQHERMFVLWGPGPRLLVLRWAATWANDGAHEAGSEHLRTDKPG